MHTMYQILFAVNINTTTSINIMSSHTRVPPKQLDQENQHQGYFANDNAKNSSSVPSKRPLLRPPLSSDKRVRVPLGGKSQNVQTPLQRSKSFIPQNAQVTRPSLSGTTTSFAPMLVAKPTLAKSNSTLGFFHQPSNSNTKTITKETNPHRNEAFPSLDAHRVKELVPRFTTDNITKQTPLNLSPLTVHLVETFSDRTSLFHASNLPNALSSHQFRDPIKKGSQSFDLLLEALAEDEDSVEIVAQKDLTPLEEGVSGYSPLRQSDLDFLRTGRRSPFKSQEVHDLSFDSTFEGDEEQNLKFKMELESGGPVGLSQKELEDLLEF